MSRLLYSLAWWLALPLVLARLLWRGRKEPGYLLHWGERLGFYGQRAAAGRAIWVHAVSVGETRAAEPLVDALLAACPDAHIVLTCLTPTGRNTGEAVFAKHGARIVQSYLPYDLAPLVARFIRHFKPRICILMETEVWPNLVAQCRAMDVPIALVNARLSERSLRRGERFDGLMGEAARAITLVAAQTEADAARIRSLGAPSVGITGSIKFDVLVPSAALDSGAAMRAQLGTRQVFLCASTREGEEAMLLDTYAALDPSSRPLLLLVPRHPQRFDEVAGMVVSRGLSLRRRSQSLDGESDVVLGDSMGEMFAYYAACDCAYIGGSLLPLGGQNLIEACAVGKPVFVGPHTFNFAQATEDAIEARAARRVADAKALFAAALALMANEGALRSAGEHALTFANQHRGATARTLDLLRPHLK